MAMMKKKSLKSTVDPRKNARSYAVRITVAWRQALESIIEVEYAGSHGDELIRQGLPLITHGRAERIAGEAITCLYEGRRQRVEIEAFGGGKLGEQL